MQILADLLNTTPTIDSAAMSRARRHVDGLLKPVGNLGKLEVLVIQLAGMPGLNDIPHVGKKAVLVICANHGIWGEGVAVSPKEATAIQAENVTRRITDTRVLAAQTGASVHVVDVGVDTAEPIPGFISMRVARGSGNTALAPAMSRRQAEKLLLDVICHTRELAKNDVALFGVGELGMANTTPAAAIVSTITGRDPGEMVGIGANPPTDKLANKVDVVRRAITLNQPNPQDDVGVLIKAGGLDLVGIARVMSSAASCGLPVLLDEFLSYAAALATCQMSSTIRPYLVPSHLSVEKGARITLSHLRLGPCLNMDMRLSEGSDIALAMSIIEAACVIYNNMGELATSDIILPGNTTSDLNS